MAEAKVKLFLDASVLVASAKSLSGGSALVLQVCQGQKFQAVSTRKVLLEAQRNIKNKFSDDELVRFYCEIAGLNLEIIEPATTEEIAQYFQVIASKDAHVLAAAIKGKASFLITLDRKHFMTSVLVKSELPISILTPGEFLQRLTL